MNRIKRASLFSALAISIYCLKWYMNGPMCPSNDRIDNKVVIITGGNTGVGKQTAIDLLNRGAKVYLACRSKERAMKAIEEIRNQTGVSSDRLLFIPLDLGSLQSIRKFVESYKQKESKLDLLINNAGIAIVPKSATVDGFESTFGVNHLGHFLLTHLSMELLVAASPSRIIIVSARAHLHGTINFDDLMLSKSYDRIASYCQSKLANILFTKELARRLQGTGVTTYAVHPGVIHTEIGRYLPLVDSFPWLDSIGGLLVWPFFKDLEHSSQTTICCAVDQSLSSWSGYYYSDCDESEPSAEAEDEAVARRLWDVSVKLVKLSPQEIHPKLR